ncbi:MAG: endolytic transglycosylase MltG [Desulfobacterales bacterium]|nr:endolytic transglycosylase MltG [Desulfobacterales bacterium]
MKKIIAFFIVVLFLGVSAGACFWLDLMHYAQTPAGIDSKTRVVVVETGDGFSAVAHRLAQAQLNPQPFKFTALARLKGYDKQIKAGEYELAATMPPQRLLEVLVSGKVRLYRLTIPEGYALGQIAQEAERAGFGPAAAFVHEATAPGQAQRYGIEAETLEGYLFPDTYHFPRNARARQVITAMVHRFQEVFTPQWQARAKEIAMTVHQVVTLASIIEKETGDAAERPLIASVFHNRLGRGMRLETDPTVIYGIENFDGNLTRKHLATATPYNTYRIRGLPPGPIASPGADALKAALYPAESPYLYFVSRKNRTHQFSTNLDDHNRAVRRYQLRR